MFNLEERVFIKSNKNKGVIKEAEANSYKVTFFDENSERKTEWFEENDLVGWRVSKPKNLDKVFFAKVKPNAIIPSKIEENAGLDIYACFDEEFIVIYPHETKMIPTGIASMCSPKYYFQLFERGSTGTKGIGQRCGVIDSGYRNEWFVPITNHNDRKSLVITKNPDDINFQSLDDYIVYPYSKAISQAVLLIVPKVEVKEILYEELLKIKSERGLTMLGESGK